LEGYGSFSDGIDGIKSTAFFERIKRILRILRILAPDPSSISSKSSDPLKKNPFVRV